MIPTSSTCSPASPTSSTDANASGGLPKPDVTWIRFKGENPVKIVEDPVGYRNTADLRADGHMDYASLIDATGLPLEVVHIGHDRVLHIRTFDYEEGLARPLVQRDIWWFDVLTQPIIEPVTVRGAMIAIHSSRGDDADNV
jgi:hypothetical protein